MKCPTNIQAVKYAAAPGPNASIPRNMATCHSLAVSISNTSSDACQTSSKCFRSPANASVPPKSCMPSTAKMNTNSTRTRTKSRSAPAPSAIFSTTWRMRLDDRSRRTVRNTRARRNARSTLSAPSRVKSSTNPTITIAASKRLNASETYSTMPKPAIFSIISPANASVNSAFRDSSAAAYVASMPWYSAAMTAVLARIKSATNVSNRGCSASRRAGAWYDHLDKNQRFVRTNQAWRINRLRNRSTSLFALSCPVFSSRTLVLAYSATTTLETSDAAKYDAKTTIEQKKTRAKTTDPVASPTCSMISPHPRRVIVWTITREAPKMSSKLVCPRFGAAPESRQNSRAPHARPPRPNASHGRFHSSRTIPTARSSA